MILSVVLMTRCSDFLSASVVLPFHTGDVKTEEPLAVRPLHVSPHGGKWWHRGSFPSEIQDELFGFA